MKEVEACAMAVEEAGNDAKSATKARSLESMEYHIHIFIITICKSISVDLHVYNG